MKGTKTQKGITLIALIITIVVLMILAAVTINSVKDGGIITHAQDAANDYTVASEKEQIQLGYSEYIMSKANNKTAELRIAGATVTGDEENGWTVTFEYSLVHGVNDRDQDAAELISILKPRNCHLNLIPVNPIKERSFEKPSRKAAEGFKNKLERSGINVTIRREMGSDIDGACGQLRRRHIESN